MDNTVKRIKNPDSLIRLGKQLRSLRELAGTPQGKVRGMRQATVSKIENGGDVTLDTVISYMSALGLKWRSFRLVKAACSVHHRALQAPARPKKI